MAFTKENKALMDLNHFESILKFGTNYKNAPNGTEQRIAYELGDDVCKNVLKMINNVNSDSVAIDKKKDPVRMFVCLKLFMENGHMYNNFCDGTCEKDAFNMRQSERDKVLHMIDIIRNFDPFA